MLLQACRRATWAPLKQAASVGRLSQATDVTPAASRFARLPKGPILHSPPRKEDVENLRLAGWKCRSCGEHNRDKVTKRCANPRCICTEWVEMEAQPLRHRSPTNSDRGMSSQRDPHTDRLSDAQLDARAERARHAPVTPPDALEVPQDADREGRAAIEELRRIEADRQRDGPQDVLTDRERENSMPPVGHPQRDEYLRNLEAQGLFGAQKDTTQGARLRSASSSRRVRWSERSASPLPSDGPGRLLPTTRLAGGTPAGGVDPMQAFFDARGRSPSPSAKAWLAEALTIDIGTVTLEEAPLRRQRSRSRPVDLNPIHEVSDVESELESCSEQGLRTAAQVANRGRCQTSGSATPATDSEEESLPSDNDMVRLVEAKTVWKFRE